MVSKSKLDNKKKEVFYIDKNMMYVIIAMVAVVAIVSLVVLIKFARLS